jgi:hypothetical protein
VGKGEHFAFTISYPIRTGGMHVESGALSRVGTIDLAAD